MVHSSVLYISERRRGPANVAGLGVAYPSYPTFSMGLRVFIQLVESKLLVNSINIIYKTVAHI